MRLLILIGTRPRELRQAEWSEFDFDNNLWSVPAERMKMHRPHVIPLSSQALAILEELKMMTSGYQFSLISSFDVLADFKKEIDSSQGKAFFTKLPIYDFLASMKRDIEDNGSIKISSEFGDMRGSTVNGVNICYQFDSGNEKLNVGNIEKIFKKFYEGVDLPVYTLTGDGDGQKSYYKISWQDAAIVRMDNHVSVSDRITTSGDYNEWIAKTVLKIGDVLPDDHVKFLKKCC